MYVHSSHLRVNLYIHFAMKSTENQRGLPLITYAPRGRGGVSLPYISIAYYIQKGGEGVQKACKIAYVINGRPQTK